MADSDETGLIARNSKGKRGWTGYKRKFTIGCGILALLTGIALAAVLILTLVGEQVPENIAPDVILPLEPLERALALQKLYPMIDGHNDLPFEFKALLRDQINHFDLRQIQPQLETDIPRLQQGEVGAQFWSVYVSCSTNQKDAVRATMEQIDVTKRMINKYPDVFQLALGVEDIKTAFEAGKIASLLGMEGGHSIDSSLGALRMFYDLGARYLTLTHSCNTPWAQSSGDVLEIPNGFTDFGNQVVWEMNRLGMLVDISHVAGSTMLAVLNVTRAPVIFSHSSAYALCNNSRNVPDNVLARMPANGGIVMVNFYRHFINCEDGNATLSQVADHIDHIRRVASIDNVGFGSDFDGVDGELPIGLEDVSKFPYLTAELIRRGYLDEEIIKVIGGNLLRVFRDVESVAESLRSSPVIEAVISYDFTNDPCRTNWLNTTV